MTQFKKILFFCLLGIIFFVLLLPYIHKSNVTISNIPSTDNKDTPIEHKTFAKGADVSWLPQMEATGFTFLNNQGIAEDVLEILKSKGINSIRLRVFVNPSNNPQSGYCGKKETVQMAQRVTQKGFKLMVAFYYSDSWTDPGKQNKPTAWKNHTFEELKNDVYNHTYEVLDTLKQLGIIPQWIQVGNEITSGMLWNDGKVFSTTNWGNLAALINAGYHATKAIDTSIKVIVHIDNGNIVEQSRWFFDNIKSQQVNYDIIGLSYYPYWLFPEGYKDYKPSFKELQNNLHELISRYHKPIMIVETGEVDIQPESAYNMLTELINLLKNLPNQQGLGVFYWEPEGAISWSKHGLSAWGSDHKPTKALDAFIEQP